MAARREKKLICGTEGEIVVAHGRLPSPTRWAGKFSVTAFVQMVYPYDSKPFSPILPLNVRILDQLEIRYFQSNVIEFSSYVLIISS